MMPRIVVSESVQAPPMRVFEIFSDFARAPDHVRGIKLVEMLTTGPVGVGTRFRETRVMFGREATETMEVTAWNPAASSPLYTLSCDSCGAHVDTTLRFHAEDGGRATRVEMDMNMQPVSLFAKIMSPLSKLMLGAMKKCVLADVADLRGVAEGGAPPSRPSQAATVIT